jgi:hypothetical protein
VPDEDLTLLEAAIRFNLDPEDLHLALEILEASRAPDGNTLTGRVALWRGVRKENGSVFTTYRARDCEAAVALEAARRLGFDPDAA